MNVDPGHPGKIFSGGKIDWYSGIEPPKFRFKRAARRLAQEQGAHGEPSVLNQSADDKAAFRDKEPSRSNQFGLRQIAVLG